MPMAPEDRFWTLVSKDCWVWLGTRRWDGYGRLTYKGKQTTANRVAWEIANGRPVPPGMHVLHKCDMPVCCNPDHLYIGTHAENMKDMNRKQRRACGEGTPSSKLTNEQVRYIKANYRKTSARRGNGSQIAKQLGINPGTVHAIGRGKTWKHIT